MPRHLLGAEPTLYPQTSIYPNIRERELSITQFVILLHASGTRMNDQTSPWDNLIKSYSDK